MGVELCRGGECLVKKDIIPEQGGKLLSIPQKTHALTRSYEIMYGKSTSWMNSSSIVIVCRSFRPNMFYSPLVDKNDCLQ